MYSAVHAHPDDCGRSTTVLVAMTDRGARDFVARNLAADDLDVLEVGSASEAVQVLETVDVDALLLDVGLPDEDGLRLVSAVRCRDAATARIDPALPMMALLDRDDTLQQLRAFDRGADDVIVKPLDYRLLLARLRALLRRSTARRHAGILRVGDLVVDPAQHTAVLAGRPIAMPNREFALLRVLASDPTRVHSKQELMRTVWGTPIVSTRTLDSHACRLRRKLSTPSGGQYVINVWGQGYRLVDGDLRAEPDWTAAAALPGGA